jgi:uncharacterized protein
VEGKPGVENVEHSDFVVYLSKLPPEGLDLSFEIDDPARAGIDLDVPVEGRIRAHFDVQRLGGEVRVSGTVGAAVRLECSRCLAPFRLDIESEADVTFAPPAQAAGAEHQHELSPDELEIEPLVQGGADLRRVIAEQIHLALPLKPLCSEGCRGICPRCGKEAAHGDCGCAPAGGDPRWEALKKLTVPGR